MDRSERGPRRRPQRAHGRAVFDSILEATRRLLDKGADLSTATVAKRAGVGIGSVYGYFQDKWSILAEVRRAKENWAADEAERIREEVRSMDLETMARTLVARALRDAREHHRVRRALNDAVPPMWVAAAQRRRNETFRRAIAALLERTLPTPPADVEERAFVLFHAVDGAIRAAVAEAPERLEDEAFAERLVEMALHLARG